MNGMVFFNGSITDLHAVCIHIHICDTDTRCSFDTLRIEDATNIRAEGHKGSLLFGWLATGSRTR